MISPAQQAQMAADDLVRAEVYASEPILRGEAAVIRDRAVRSLKSALLQLEGEPLDMAA